MRKRLKVTAFVAARAVGCGFIPLLLSHDARTSQRKSVVGPADSRVDEDEGTPPIPASVAIIPDLPVKPYIRLRRIRAKSHALLWGRGASLVATGGRRHWGRS
jgi:hypothetical protein